MLIYVSSIYAGELPPSVYNFVMTGQIILTQELILDTTFMWQLVCLS